jgi:TonB family protein
VDSVTGEPCTPQGKSPAQTDVTLPKGISTPEPEYGELSRRARVNGGARVLLDIGADGLVKRACLLDAIQPDLGEQAVKAVRLWRFEPARKGGEPIPSTSVIEVEFTIYPWRQGT